MKRRTSTMTKIVLLISFIILFGRLLYSSIGAISHHQDKRAEAIEQSQSLPANQDKAR